MSLAFLSIVSFHFKRKSMTRSRRSGAARTPDRFDLIPMCQIFESNFWRHSFSGKSGAQMQSLNDLRPRTLKATW
ncbi:MAG: hypothetical protein DWI02_09335 [Planctomycetota bacterium]|nr:MAG: hypothetical protein DWI02_09335 [Planctomycetota bacterium]